MRQQPNLSSILKYLRNDRNYTQRQVSATLHISEQAYSHYETGIRTPPYDILYQLSQFYQVDFSLFLTALQHNEELHNAKKEMVCKEKLSSSHTISKDSFILLDQCKHLTEIDQNELLFYTKMKADKRIP